eukprot:m.1573635 g.1573635  ORF g.1573635 m.1573635 type:complete len:2177 (-) comp25305_c0_seq17:2175-8705(-)
MSSLGLLTATCWAQPNNHIIMEDDNDLVPPAPNADDASEAETALTYLDLARKLYCNYDVVECARLTQHLPQDSKDRLYRMVFEMDPTNDVPTAGTYLALIDPATVQELHLLRLSNEALPLVIEKLQNNTFPNMTMLKLTYMSIKDGEGFASLIRACKDRLVGITASIADRSTDPFQEVVREALVECPNLVKIEFTGCEKGHSTDLVMWCAAAVAFAGKLKHVGLYETRQRGAVGSSDAADLPEFLTDICKHQPQLCSLKVSLQSTVTEKSLALIAKLLPHLQHLSIHSSGTGYLGSFKSSRRKQAKEDASGADDPFNDFISHVENQLETLYIGNITVVDPGRVLSLPLLRQFHYAAPISYGGLCKRQYEICGPGAGSCLERVEIHSSTVEAIDFSKVCQLPKLREFELGGCGDLCNIVPPADPTGFPALEKLKIYHYDPPPLSAKCLDELLRAAPNLKEVSVAFKKVSQITVAPDSLQSLESFYMWDAGGAVDGTIVSSIAAAAPNLKSFHVQSDSDRKQSKFRTFTLPPTAFKALESFEATYAGNLEGSAIEALGTCAVNLRKLQVMVTGKQSFRLAPRAFPHLKQFYFPQNASAEIVSMIALACPSLSSFTVQGPMNGVLSLPSKCLPKVETVAFNNSPTITTDEMEMVFRACHQATAVSINNCPRVEPVKLEGVCHLLPKARSVTVGTAELTNSNTRSGTESMDDLETIVMQYGTASPAGIYSLASWAPTLKSLKLQYFQWKDDSADDSLVVQSPGDESTANAPRQGFSLKRLETVHCNNLNSGGFRAIAETCNNATTVHVTVAPDIAICRPLCRDSFNHCTTMNLSVPASSVCVLNALLDSCPAALQQLHLTLVEPSEERLRKRSRPSPGDTTPTQDNYLETDSVHQLAGDSIPKFLPSLTHLHLMQVSDELLSQLLFASAPTLQSLYVCSQTIAWFLCPASLPKVTTLHLHACTLLEGEPYVRLVRACPNLTKVQGYACPKLPIGFEKMTLDALTTAVAPPAPIPMADVSMQSTASGNVPPVGGLGQEASDQNADTVVKESDIAPAATKQMQDSPPTEDAFDPTAVGECSGTYKWHTVPTGSFTPRGRYGHYLEAFVDRSTPGSASVLLYGGCAEGGTILCVPCVLKIANSPTASEKSSTTEQPTLHVSWTAVDTTGSNPFGRIGSLRAVNPCSGNIVVCGGMNRYGMDDGISGALLGHDGKVWAPLVSDESGLEYIHSVSNVEEHSSCALSDTLRLFVASGDRTKGVCHVLVVFDFATSRWKKCIPDKASEVAKLPTDFIVLTVLAVDGVAYIVGHTPRGASTTVAQDPTAASTRSGLVVFAVHMLPSDDPTQCLIHLKRVQSTTESPRLPRSLPGLTAVPVEKGVCVFVDCCGGGAATSGLASTTPDAAEQSAGIMLTITGAGSNPSCTWSHVQLENAPPSHRVGAAACGARVSWGETTTADVGILFGGCSEDYATVYNDLFLLVRASEPDPVVVVQSDPPAVASENTSAPTVVEYATQAKRLLSDTGALDLSTMARVLTAAVLQVLLEDVGGDITKIVLQGERLDDTTLALVARLCEGSTLSCVDLRKCPRSVVTGPMLAVLGRACPKVATLVLPESRHRTAYQPDDVVSRVEWCPKPRSSSSISAIAAESPSMVAMEDVDETMYSDEEMMDIEANSDEERQRVWRYEVLDPLDASDANASKWERVDPYQLVNASYDEDESSQADTWVVGETSVMAAIATTFPCLKKLVLSGGAVMLSATTFCSDDDIVAVAKGCPLLSDLRFTSGRFALSPSGLLAAVQAMPQLRFLQFPKIGTLYSGISFSSPEVAAILQAMPAAQGLNLTHLGYVDPTWFETVPTTLQTLRWAGEGMGYGGVSGSVSDVHLETLVKRCLDLHSITAIGSMISDTGVEALTKTYSRMADFTCPAGMSASGLANIATSWSLLSVLDMGGFHARVDEATWEAVGKQCRNLQKLVFGNSVDPGVISNEGLDLLLRHTPKLTSLALPCSITHAGVVSVGTHARELRHLIMPFNDSYHKPVEELITLDSLVAVTRGCTRMQSVTVMYPCLWPPRARRTLQQRDDGADLWVEAMVDGWSATLESFTLNCEDKAEEENRRYGGDFNYAAFDEQYGLPKVYPAVSALLHGCPKLSTVIVHAPEETDDPSPLVQERILRDRFPGADISVALSCEY